MYFCYTNVGPFFSYQGQPQAETSWRCRAENVLPHWGWIVCRSMANSGSFVQAAGSRLHSPSLDANTIGECRNQREASEKGLTELKFMAE